MDCLLHVIEGPDNGMEYPLPPGSHIVGRGSKAAFRLTPEDVSWEHAVITREGDDYFVENLSALGTWVGDAKISGRVKLRPRDKVRLSGDCVLRLDIAGGGGLLASRGMLAVALIVMVSVLVAVMFFSSEMGGSGTENWDAAYQKLEPWVSEQAKLHRIQPEAIDLFRRAWRLAVAGDWEHSLADWMNLQIALDDAEDKMHCLANASREPKDESLAALLAPASGKVPPGEDQYPAAFAEFVTRYGKFTAAKLKENDSMKMFGKSKSGPA